MGDAAREHPVPSKTVWLQAEQGDLHAKEIRLQVDGSKDHHPPHPGENSCNIDGIQKTRTIH
ncbi:hypothetical protein [Salibacterium sp. K-3]